MESIDESIENSQEKVEPIHLFENSWFFNNLFNTHKRTPSPIIPRCYSDPCPSFSNHHQPEISPPPPPVVDKSMEEAFLAIKKLPSTEGGAGGGGGGGGRFSRPAGLTRAPSLPEESAPQRVRKSNLQRSFSPKNNQIARAPSLPASMMIRDEIHDDESDFSMSRLIRQASLHQSDLLPPRSSSSSSSKGVVVVGSSTRSPSTPKQRQRTKPADIDNSNSNSGSSSSASGGGVSASLGGVVGGGVRRQQQQQQQQQQHQYGGNRTRLARSTSDIGFQELVGFREVNYVENKQQEQITEEQWGVDKRRSVEDDMKAQIKFWARTVASNVK